MKISERTVKRLGEVITGDKGISPYRGGPKLVSFFNECGTNHSYGQGFPSKWMFAEGCIRQFNGTPTMKKVILSAVDPRDCSAKLNNGNGVFVLSGLFADRHRAL
jgi:hypothetical protein